MLQSWLAHRRVGTVWVTRGEDSIELVDPSRVDQRRRMIDRRRGLFPVRLMTGGSRQPGCEVTTAPPGCLAWVPSGRAVPAGPAPAGCLSHKDLKVSAGDRLRDDSEAVGGDLTWGRVVPRREATCERESPMSRGLSTVAA